MSLRKDGAALIFFVAPLSRIPQMARQINVFSPADAGVYPLRIAEYFHAPGTRVTRGTAIVRLEGAKGNIRLAAPFDALIVRNAALSGTTLNERTALVTLEVADADLPPARPAAPDPERPPEPETGKAAAEPPHAEARPRMEIQPPRTKRRYAVAAAALAAAAFVWWATPTTRAAFVLTGGDLSILTRAMLRDATRIPARLFGEPTSPSGSTTAGFTLEKTGKASLRCTGKHVYFFAGSLFTGGKEIRSETDNGLATIDFDFSKRLACVRFGRILKYDDGSLNDDLGAADCVGYEQHQGNVELNTTLNFSVDYAEAARLRLSDMALAYEEGSVDKDTRSEIVESTSYDLTCKPVKG